MNIEDDRLLGYVVKHQKYMCIILSLTRRKILPRKGWSEVTEIIERREVKELKPKEYAFVIDINGRKLAPTNINKAWILIRKHKAILISKYPVVIQLKREIKDTELDE